MHIIICSYVRHHGGMDVIVTLDTFLSALGLGARAHCFVHHLIVVAGPGARVNRRVRVLYFLLPSHCF